MPTYDEEKEALTFVYDKEIDLYDVDEAGRTCQKLMVNGKEITINEFKKGKNKQEKAKGHSWKRKHGFEPIY